MNDQNESIVPRIQNLPDRYPPARHSALSTCIHSLYGYLRRYNRLDCDQARRISDATARERGQFFKACIRDLCTVAVDGKTYLLRDIANLKPKHVKHLVAIWESRGYSAGTIQKYFTFLRTLCGWIGKKGLIGDAAQYLSDPKRAKRIRIATADRSWTAQGVDIEALISEVYEHDPHVGICLMLQQAFGLRVREAWLLRIQESFGRSRTILYITHGTKNNLSREYPITAAWQIELLEKSAEMANAATGSQIPARYGLDKWKNHFYYICRCHGIKRKNGVVTHGLRHAVANDDYEELAGFPSPVRAGEKPLNYDKLKDHIARLEVSKRLGHRRKQVSSAYLGSFLKPRNQDTTDSARANLSDQESDPKKT
jgi:integrase